MCLRTWYIAGLVGSMLLIAVSIEIALHFSQKNSGAPFFLLQWAGGLSES